MVVLTARGPIRRRRAALAGGLAIGAHLLVLLALGWRAPKVEPRFAGDVLPPMALFLVRPTARRREPTPTQAAKAAPSPPAAAPRVLNIPAPAAPLVSAPKPAQPNADADLQGEQLRGALRGLLGCTLAAHRSPEEQQACDQRLAKARPAQVGPIYSAREAAAFNENKESIFTRKPHNECLPHVGNTDTPGGASAGSTTFGLACEWDFW
jgi:hypothetical protein